MAVATGSAELVRILLRAGANPSSQDSGASFLPLEAAVFGQSASVIRLLVEAGADPEAKGRFGLSMADLAANIARENPDDEDVAMRLRRVADGACCRLNQVLRMGDIWRARVVAGGLECAVTLETWREDISSEMGMTSECERDLWTNLGRGSDDAVTFLVLGRWMRAALPPVLFAWPSNRFVERHPCTPWVCGFGATDRGGHLSSCPVCVAICATCSSYAGR
jgi:hypothetical protein